MFGKHTDKYLIGIVVGSIVLVITSMFMVQSMPEPSYKDGVSPESVAHNYLLALHQDDYVRAYSYLSMQLDGYPQTADEFEDLVLNNSWDFRIDDNDNVQTEVIEVDIEDDRARVLVRETTFYSGGIFSDGYDSSTFRMTLRLDNNVWKIRSASRYWSNCLNDTSACQKLDI